MAHISKIKVGASEYDVRNGEKYSKIYEQQCSGGVLSVRFDSPQKDVIVLIECSASSTRSATNLYAKQGDTNVGRMYFGAATNTVINVLYFRCWDQNGMFLSEYCCPAGSTTSGTFGSYPYYIAQVSSGITSIYSASTPTSCVVRIYGIPM